MRIGRVIGSVTLNRKLASMPAGRLLMVDALDAQALAGVEKQSPRKNPMGESLVVFDELGAGVGQLIAISEGREACSPFWPKHVPLDAYCAALIDTIQTEEMKAGLNA